MSNDPRLRGQEVEIRLTREGVPELSIALVSNFDETLKLEKKQDGFLGEVTDRYDHTFHGVDGKLDIQVNDYTWMQFQNAIKAQAQRKTPGTVFTIVRTDYYSNGQTAIITYADCKFGQQPTSVAGRGEFVKVSMDFSSSDRDEQFLNGTP